MWIEPSTLPVSAESRSDISTVAVGFSPRWRDERNGVAERRLNRWVAFDCRYATDNLLLPPFRGLKPTATIIASLREAATAPVSQES
jgi:hypothetical protein